MEVDKDLYPISGFNFRVTSSEASMGLGTLTQLTGIDINSQDGSFKSVKGISATLKFDSYNELANNNSQITLPLGISYADLELSKGIVKRSSSFGQWCSDFLTSYNTFYMVRRKTVNVFLIDVTKEEILASWTFYNCYPINVSVSDFDAMDGKSIAIETIKLKYSRFQKNSVL